MVSNLKDRGLIILHQVEGECVSVHEGSAAIGENVHTLHEELDLDPGHFVLLQLPHLLFDSVVQLVLQFKGLQMVRVPREAVYICPKLLFICSWLPGVVEQILLKGGPAGVAAGLRLVWYVLVALVIGVVPPVPQTHPAEARLAGLVPAVHVVAAPVLLDGCSTLNSVFIVQCQL